MLLAFDISKLPTSGPAWENLIKEAAKITSSTSMAGAIGARDDQRTVQMYARALKAAKTGNTGDRQIVVDLLNKLPSASIQDDSGSLGPARNVAAIALSADLVGHKTASLLTFLGNLRTRDFGGRSIISTHNDRPNNWGTHAGASRMAIDRLLGDTAEFNKAVAVFKGYLGDRDAYASFKFGDPAWQVPPPRPVNPKGATKTIDGGMRNVDGVLVDDQRRQGDQGHATPGRYATWPPAKENYPWEAFQGVVLQAELCYGAGLKDVYEWQDRAILRAAKWLYEQAKNPAVGDDLFIPWVLNCAYGNTFTAVTSPGNMDGKGWGFTDWSHSLGRAAPVCEAEKATLEKAKTSYEAALTALNAAQAEVDRTWVILDEADAALTRCLAG